MLKLALLAAVTLVSLASLAGCHRGPIVVELRQSRAEQAGYLVVDQAQCSRAALCTDACSGDDAACRRGCLTAISPSAAKLAEALLVCGERHGCNGDTSCARSRCTAEVAACAGG
jgi:hypothetical protein